MTDSIDVAIAGGGLAGFLTAAKIKELHPEYQVAIFEKQSSPGGRLTQVDEAKETWSFGLNTISRPLFEFWNQSLKFSPDSPDLDQFSIGRQSQIGSMSGSDLGVMPIEGFFAPKGARLIGGLTASREWAAVEEILKTVAADPETSESSISSVWKLNRKGPAAIVIEQMAHAFGIPDIWSCSVRALIERSRYHTSQLISGKWQQALLKMSEVLSGAGGFQLHLNSMVGSAKQVDGLWHLHTGAGNITAKALVVAQPVWDAINWLPQDYWPAQVLSVALKSKPVSVVSISDRMVTKLDLPQVIIVPAEDTQIVISPDKGEIVFQSTLDYELSLQAPECVKAVKRVKRARKKFQNAVKEVELFGEHIALSPVGWAQSTTASDRRHFERLGKQNFCEKNLGFCGDNYGSSYDGDDNLMKSVLSVCANLAIS